VTVYTAICEREDGWWVITVPELESVRMARARALREVPATVADLVVAMTGADPASVEVNLRTRKRTDPTPATEPHDQGTERRRA